VKKVYAWKSFVEALWQKKVPIEFVTDSAPLMEQLKTGKVRSEPRLQGMLRFVRQKLRAMRTKTLWCPIDVMRADRQIKLKLSKDRGTQYVPRDRSTAVKSGVRRKVIDFAKKVHFLCP